MTFFKTYMQYNISICFVNKILIANFPRLKNKYNFFVTYKYTDIYFVAKT